MSRSAPGIGGFRHQAGPAWHSSSRSSTTRATSWSADWDGVRLEGEVLFPDDDHNYLGFIYGYQRTGDRIDFGSLYIKGNGSYVQGNTHRDTNVGRTYLPEARTDLVGPHAITIGA